MDRLMADRERIGPVNLVAAEELARIEQEHGASAAEQAELHEAVSRLRGSIGNLNRARAASACAPRSRKWSQHFRRLFTPPVRGRPRRHLRAGRRATVSAEAGLEIFAQPPGKRADLAPTLLSGERAGAHTRSGASTLRPD